MKLMTSMLATTMLVAFSSGAIAQDAGYVGIAMPT